MNKRIFKRCLCGILAAALAATALVGFSGCGGSSGDSLTVMYYAQTHEQTVYEDMKEAFLEANPDISDVELQQVQSDQYATNVTTALASGNMADVFYVEPTQVARYVEQGQIVALDDLMTDEMKTNAEDIWPDAVNAFRYDAETQTTQTGSLYALPHDYSSMVYAYNKTLFDEKGVAYPDADTPYTWAEFKEVCKLFSDGNESWGCALPNEYIFPQLLYSNGGHFLSDDLKTVDIVGQSEFLETLEFFVSLVQEDLAPLPSEDAALTVYTRWLSGQVAFYPCGTWDVANFNDEETLPYDWDMTYYPVGPSGNNTTAARAGTIGYAIYSGSENKEAAMKFIDYYSTNVEGQTTLSDAGIQLPNLMSVAKGDYATKLENGELTYCDNYQVVFKYMEGASDGTYTYKNEMGEYTYTPSSSWWTMFLSELDSVKTGDYTPEEYVEYIAPEMQSELDTAWSEYNAILGNG